MGLMVLPFHTHCRATWKLTPERWAEGDGWVGSVFYVGRVGRTKQTAPLSQSPPVPLSLALSRPS